MATRLRFIACCVFVSEKHIFVTVCVVICSVVVSSVSQAFYQNCLSVPFDLQEQSKMMAQRSFRIALELSDLVVYCRPVPFDIESESLPAV